MIYFLVVGFLLSSVSCQYNLPYSFSPSSNGHQIIRKNYRNVDFSFEKDAPKPDSDEQNQKASNKNFLLNNKPIYVQIVPQSLHTQLNSQGQQSEHMNQGLELQKSGTYGPPSNKQKSEMSAEYRNGNENNNRRMDMHNGDAVQNQQMSYTNDFKEDKHIYVHFLGQGAQNSNGNIQPSNGNPTILDSNYHSPIQTPAIPVFPVLPQGNKVYILAKNPIEGDNQNPTDKYGYH